MSMVYEEPLERKNGLDVYELPIPDHEYVMTVDVSRGVSNDYSAFVVVDITTIPYKVVAKYKNNNKRYQTNIRYKNSVQLNK